MRNQADSGERKCELRELGEKMRVEAEGVRKREERGEGRGVKRRYSAQLHKNLNFRDVPSWACNSSRRFKMRMQDSRLSTHYFALEEEPLLGGIQLSVLSFFHFFLDPLSQFFDFRQFR